LLFLIFYSLCALDIPNILLQNWGNHADISQAVAIYVCFVCDVLLICWFGTQLTQHVRQKGFYLSLLTFCYPHYVHNVDVASNQLRSYDPIWILRIFQLYKLFYTKQSFQIYENGFVSIWRFSRRYSPKIFKLFKNFM